MNLSSIIELIAINRAVRQKLLRRELIERVFQNGNADTNCLLIALIRVFCPGKFWLLTGKKQFKISLKRIKIVICYQSDSFIAAQSVFYWISVTEMNFQWNYLKNSWIKIFSEVSNFFCNDFITLVWVIRTNRFPRALESFSSLNQDTHSDFSLD